MRKEIAIAIKQIQAIAAKPISNAEKEKELDALMRNLGACNNSEAKDIATILQHCQLPMFAGVWLTRRLQAPRKNEKVRPGTPER